ncbi:KRAB-A domain-containing protein 2 [Ditylenchus destructor]|uniref:KRAB-A domain-containing protein 2 n=1 Tax=Ditylenchus destructor TaxID=166010 RepID=A0AAD4MGV7_9BILA|nr:KRAB-A domain-containing protein 2 [Ditylenchus destructor]
MNRAEYDAKLHRLIEIESDHSIKKTPADYKLRGKFDILSVDVEGTIVKKLVKKGTQLRYVCKEDLYETIHRAHRDKGHSGRVIMYKHLSANFANVTQEQISDYLAFCESCQKKKSAMRKSIVVKPIISSHMNSRGQVLLEANSGISRLI